ncbi:hypothetical protein SHIRM173S_02208 [Streptomyces hirsutus]
MDLLVGDGGQAAVVVEGFGDDPAAVGRGDLLLAGAQQAVEDFVGAVVGLSVGLEGVGADPGLLVVVDAVGVDDAGGVAERAGTVRLPDRPQAAERVEGPLGDVAVGVGGLGGRAPGRVHLGGGAVQHGVGGGLGRQRAVAGVVGDVRGLDRAVQGVGRGGWAAQLVVGGAGDLLIDGGLVHRAVAGDPVGGGDVTLGGCNPDRFAVVARGDVGDDVVGDDRDGRAGDRVGLGARDRVHQPG